MVELGRDIIRSAVVDLVGRALSTAALLLTGLLVWLVASGATLPAWVAVGLLVMTVVAVLLLRVRSRALIERLGDELARSTEYSTHLSNALDSLQRVICGDVSAEMPYYVEQAVLAPARDMLTAKPTESVRLSVLWPDANEPDRWTMAWSAGHSMIGKLKYRELIGETLARHAFERGQSQYWSDVETQADFRQHPLASAATRSMVSLPIRRGDETLGVFNAVSAETKAFDEADQTFLASLAGVIAVAMGVWFEQELAG